ncbi:MAG: PaaI family thioesterase [Desulfuromonadales bacterium]|nr:PaaI family thioesterase [Desulfuromonadales bacterium]MBN2792243.1 PaaI family thioesterase [Desulfuromonadales bacterium]
MSREPLRQVVNDTACFVCGPDNPIGLKARFEVDKNARTSYARLTLTDHFQGWQDVVHGGILATLLDEACAYACMAVVKSCVTAEIKVRYRKPVPVGRVIEIFGHLVDDRRKIWTAQAQIKIDGTLHAEAESKMFILEQS